MQNNNQTTQASNRLNRIASQICQSSNTPPSLTTNECSAPISSSASMEKDFDNKVVLITGSASGFGKKLLQDFYYKTNAKLVVSDWNEEEGRKVVNELSSERGRERVRFFRCDVRSEEQVKNLIDFAVKEFGRLDCCFNNAGVTGKIGFGRTEHWTEQELDLSLNINTKGVFFCMKYELLQFRKQQRDEQEDKKKQAEQRIGGRGEEEERKKEYTIVNTSSLVGVVGGAGQAGYSAAKHAVVGLTKSAAVEYGRYNIRVNCVCPSIIFTPMSHGLVQLDSVLNSYLASHPMRRIGHPSEVCDVVMFLLSFRSSYINGVALPIDGAISAQ